MAPANPLRALSPTPVSGGGGDILRLVHFLERRQATASATSGAPSSTSTNGSNQNNNQQWGWAGNKTQILNWAAIAVVVGLLVMVGGWRLATARHKSFKGLFLPRGLRIKFLHIDISPPPPPPAQPTFREVELQRRARRAEERFQRRRTRGDNIGEGGQRIDGHEVDYDDDDGADRETLPGYKADATVPVYMEEWREQAVQRGEVPELDEETLDAIRRNGNVVREGADAATAGQRQDNPMSVAEYEARIRGEDVPTTALGGPVGAAATRDSLDQDPEEPAARAREAYPPQQQSNQTSRPTSPAHAAAALGAASRAASPVPSPAVSRSASIARPQPVRLHSGQPPMYEVPLDSANASDSAHAVGRGGVTGGISW